MIVDAKPCPKCGGTNLDWSCGALFEGFHVFCTDCGVVGGMSQTGPAEPNNQKRQAQALANWNADLIEKTGYEHAGGEYFWPPIKASTIFG